jgi:hypothetical protein
MAEKDEHYGTPEAKASWAARSSSSNEGRGLRKFLSAGEWIGLGVIVGIITLVVSLITWLHPFANGNHNGAQAETNHNATPSTAGTSGQICPGRLPAPSYVLVFCDDFRQYNWQDYENPNQAYANPNGSGYTVNSITDGDMETVAPANAPSSFAVESEHSAGMSVTANAVDGQGGEYGLLCQAGPGAGFRAKAYLFEVQGEKAVIKKLEDRKKFEITKLAESGYLSNLHPTNNLLQARCTPDRSAVALTFWINGKSVVYYVDKSHTFPGGYIGVFAEKATQDKAVFTVNFRNFGAYNNQG